MTTSDFPIALATIRDAGEIARLSRDLIEVGLSWSWRADRVAASIRNPSANVAVARTGARIAAFGIMRYGDEEAHLDLLAVEPAHRRQGLGRRLLAWLEEPARAGGIVAITLEVREENRAAQDFYRRLGYRRLASLDGYYQGRETAVRMRRELGRARDAGARTSGPATS